MPGVVPEDDDAQWFCEHNVDRKHSKCDVPQQADDAVLDTTELDMSYSYSYVGG